MGRIHPNSVWISSSVIIGIRRVLIIRSFNFPFFILKQLILDLRWRLGSVTRGFVRSPWETILAIVRGSCGCTPYHGALSLYSLVAVPSLRGPPDQVRTITILSYRNQALCYSRTVAYFSGSAMLFSSGGSPQSTSSNLSGEGFDEVQPGELPFFVSASSNSLSSGLLEQLRLHSQTDASTRLSSHAAQRQHVRLQSRHQNQRAKPQ